MTREFFRKVCKLGIVKTRNHEYKRIIENGLIKIIREDGLVLACYCR